MSETYSTEELVKIIKNGMLFVEGSRLLISRRVADAIIARLRAADKLCARDKEMVIKVTGGTGITLGEMAEWVEAIAEYEGKP